MSTLAPAARVDASSSGWGYYACTRKERRIGRQGRAFLALTLQDASGSIGARVLDDVARWEGEFDAGEFVRVQAHGDRQGDRIELVVDAIRRVNPDQDRRDGFREELCVPTAPRPAAEMWADLEAVVASVRDPDIRRLLVQIMTEKQDRLLVWPAAVTVHHAYRAGLLEHILQIATVGSRIAEAYGADPDLVVAGAVLHDIGKLEELDYDLAARYSTEGNLIGHIVLGVQTLTGAAARAGGIPGELLTRLTHLVLSHHGERELGSPVEPMMPEAFILAAVDDLDATLNQVHRHLSASEGDAPFTPYHTRLGRVLLKPRVRTTGARR